MRCFEYKQKRHGPATSYLLVTRDYRSEGQLLFLPPDDLGQNKNDTRISSVPPLHAAIRLDSVSPLQARQVACMQPATPNAVIYNCNVILVEY